MKKKILSILGITLISSTMFGQVSVPQIISTTNVKDIYIRGNNRGLMYSDNVSHHIQSDNQGNITSNVIYPLANNIGESELFLYGDTLSQSMSYYGNSSSVFDGTNTFNTFNPVNALTRDNDTIFALGKYGSDYNILAINNGIQTFLSNPNFNGVNSNLIDYSDMDYFELNGTRYIAFVGKQYSFSPYQLSVYNIDTRQYYQTIENASSATFSRDTLFYSQNNEIYKITNITPNANPLFNDITSTIAYDIPVGQTINEFDFCQDAFSNDSIYIAASDGVYAESTRFIPSATGIIKNNKTSLLDIYPNPSTQYIHLINVEKDSPYKIYNQLGVMVLNGKTNQEINIENLNNGIYFLSIEDYPIQKIIKQ